MVNCEVCLIFNLDLSFIHTKYLIKHKKKTNFFLIETKRRFLCVSISFNENNKIANIYLLNKFTFFLDEMKYSEAIICISLCYFSISISANFCYLKTHTNHCNKFDGVPTKNQTKNHFFLYNLIKNVWQKLF